MTQQQTLFNLDDFNCHSTFKDIVNNMVATNWKLNIDNLEEMSSMYRVPCKMVMDAYDCILGNPKQT